LFSFRSTVLIRVEGVDVHRIDGSRFVLDEEGLAIRKSLEQKFDAAIVEKSASARLGIASCL
jgi:hypothetical protein